MKPYAIGLIAIIIVLLAGCSYRYWEYSECRSVGHGMAYCWFHTGD